MLNISPNMYNGGAVVLNNDRHTQFMANLMARKAAKDEALDEYYKKRNENINSEGMRTVDIPAFTDKVKNLQDFWMQNKKAIRNPTSDGGKAQSIYNNLYQDAAMFPQASKAEELKKKPFMDLLADPDKRERVTDKMVSDVHAHDLPLMGRDGEGRWIDNPYRKSFDITQETFNPKEFTTEQWQKYYDGVGKGITPNKNEIVTKPDPNDPYSNIVTTATRYSNDQLKAIGDLAKDDFLKDDSLQYSFEKSHPFKEWKADHPSQFETLNSIHKSVYGEEIKDDADLHSSIVLQKKIEPTMVAKKEDNWKARDDRNFAQQKELQRSSQNFQAWLRKQPTWGQEHEGGEDAAYNDMYSRIKNKVDSVDYSKYKGLPLNRLDNDAQSFINKFVNEQVSATDSKGKEMTLDNSNYYVAPSDDGGIGVYLTKQTAQDLGRAQLVGSISAPSVNPKINTGRSKEEAIKQSSKQGGNSDSYSRSELKKAGWTDAQIETARKAGKIKVHD